MGENICLAKQIKVNLGKNDFVICDIWHNEDGTLEIIPMNKVGDPSDWSRVLTYKEYDYGLASKWIGLDEEE